MVGQRLTEICSSESVLSTASPTSQKVPFFKLPRALAGKEFIEEDIAFLWRHGVMVLLRYLDYYCLLTSVIILTPLIYRKLRDLL